MTKYTKKPVTIQAFQLSDCHAKPLDPENGYYPRPDWFKLAIDNADIILHDNGTATIKTLEGDHLANNDDYIIQGVKGEIYPCKPDIFEATYLKGTVTTVEIRKESGEMCFGLAIEALKHGLKVARKGWNGKGMFLLMVSGNAWDFVCDVSGVDDLDTEPFACMKTAQDTLIPWLASQADIFATDWCIVTEDEQA